MINIDKAYYLKDLELAVLLSMKGMDELYGFRMKQVRNPKTEDVYEALFALSKRGLLTFREEERNGSDRKRITIEPDLDAMLEIITEAKHVLIYSSERGDHPSRCIYLGKRAVFVSTQGTDGIVNRVSACRIETLPEMICECGFQPDELAGGSDAVPGESTDGGCDGAGNILPDMIREDAITDRLKWISVTDKQCVRQYLLIRDGLYEYCAVTDHDGRHIESCLSNRIAELLRKDLSSVFSDTVF